MPRLLVEKGPDRGKSLSVTGHSPVVIGRDAEADLQLSDVLSSRRHFMIGCKGSVFGLKDLDSANGTLVNGRKADGPTRLAYGDSIQVGETLLSWLADEQQAKAGGLVGHVVGGYKIEERLGRGAMGTVYKAIQLSLGRTVALKVLSPDLTKDSKFCDMFIKEARAAGGLNHPNIIQVYDVGEDNGSYYFSMEYAAKGSVLDQLNKSRRVDLAHAVTIIKDTCRALDYAEKKGLVHRDIKPDNLMVTEDNSVKLGDLGLAMSAQELQGEQAGVFGTPHYIAPEQAMGKPIDHRADLYALGASFYRILSGHTLFQGGSVKEILKKQVRDPHPPITTFMPDCPAGIVTIIDRMLAKSPAERYQHAADILNDLENWENLIAKRGGFNPAAFATPQDARRMGAETTLAQAQKSKGLAVATLAAVGAVAVLILALWLFVFNKPGASTNNVDNSSGTDSNVVANNLPPDDRDKGLPRDVLEADTNVNQAIGQARLLFERGSTKELEEARDLLEKALKNNPKSTRLDQATRQLNRIRDELGRRMAETGDVDSAWESVRRAYMTQMDEYQFHAAAKTLGDFIADPRWVTSENPHVKLVMEAANIEWNTFWRRADSVVEDLDRSMRNGRSEAEKISDKNRAILRLEETLIRPRDFVSRTDDAERRTTVSRVISQIEDLIGTYRDDLKVEAERRLKRALDECERALQNELVFIMNEVRDGNFDAADKRLENFEKNNSALREFGSEATFAPVHELIRLRRMQTRIEFEALRLLLPLPAGGGVLPSFSEQRTLLRAKPLPPDAEALFGDKAHPVLLIPRDRDPSRGRDAYWMMMFYKSGGTSENWPCSHFGQSGVRKPQALAAALTHVLVNHEPALTRLMQPSVVANLEDPAAAVGIWAWLAELGGGYEAFPLMDRAYAESIKSLPDGSAARRATREYMAYALLAYADGLTAAGKREDAKKALDRFNSEEFAGCRARKGR